MTRRSRLGPSDRALARASSLVYAKVLWAVLGPGTKVLTPGFEKCFSKAHNPETRQPAEHTWITEAPKHPRWTPTIVATAHFSVRGNPHLDSNLESPLRFHGRIWTVASRNTRCF